VRQRVAQENQASIALANIQDQVAEQIVEAHAQLEAAATQVDEAAIELKEAGVTYSGNLRGIAQTVTSGDALRLVTRPQEAVAALQQLYQAYGVYYAAINNYNRAQFQLYRALGFPSQILLCDHPVGEVQPVDSSRPASMPPSDYIPVRTVPHR
jgi:hypothetical protein